MKRGILIGLLLLNFILGFALARNVRARARARSNEPGEVLVVPPETKRQPPRSRSLAPVEPIPRPTPYAAVYSPRPSDFAANLRRVGCPEETVKDILSAEVNRRYHSRENQLKPKPADHVPFMWSPKTSEAKLIERRQQAAEIAREKADALRAALGYDVQVSMPLYAMTTSDQRFSKEIEAIPAKNHKAAYAAQDQYWLMVEQLRNRTRGFWEPEDVEELNQLKQQRREVLDSLKEGQP